MSIELRTGRDGKLRSMWYGRYEVNGKRYTINLGVKVAGTPPESLSLRDEGDNAFERSRAQAQERLKQTIEEARQKHVSSHLVERIYEIKTGERIKSISLAELSAEWERIPRRRKPSERYAAQCRSTLTRFAEFVKKQNPKADELTHVTRDMARKFMEAEEKRLVVATTRKKMADKTWKKVEVKTWKKVTAKTWNDTIKLLRATYKHLLPEGSINPFSNMPTRETDTVFRRPFTPEELKGIFDAAEKDNFIRPIIITGACTAMRRGDCCLLKWADVDLTGRFITVKTAKTGVTVNIPIFSLLYDELMDLKPSAARARRSSSVAETSVKAAGEGGYVFPEQAKMYCENPDGITWRVRKVFAAAGFKDDGENGENGKNSASKAPNKTPPLRGEIHAERKDGCRRASVRDFHSFRVTWVTVALTAGVPLELVQKVTGHKTTEIVLKHYFQPGREEFRRALQTAMPKLLTNGEKTPKDQMLEILDQTAAETWKKDVGRLRLLIERL